MVCINCFVEAYQLAQDQWYNQSELCPNGGEVWPMGMLNDTWWKIITKDIGTRVYTLKMHRH